MGILDWLLGKKSKHSEVKDIGIEKGKVKKKRTVKPKKKASFRKEGKKLITAEEGYTEIVEMLLTKGADVNARDEGGWTALKRAAGQGHTEIVEMLLAKGADVNAKDEDGGTALIEAAQKGHTKIFSLLKQAGAKK